ncbi:UDP-N-acetylmuramoyl-L-alanine--D-glutamate ligase [Rhodococcus sp. (in: high G+C Gram-positive bacteria)]|uniref:UDP-N-acetylmuramoyl-L-alanine--D-glutamate ligase n=1 Tax=Rhodococcus sp. TaxID=1831 RepID=UPI001A00B2A3|nr:UDP-N-acetylmuramoyl-L-alanine--D-glutamate ligase [Rhodococcus sp. (in: high G+C Gram-positive bacteria)]MBF0660065.1 UDP-N-acetylmuramoyl-L-alanine--D-glutamate ligase [Rhodococcus sp. (in: high G+C Gram-positive bacteria)]
MTYDLERLRGARVLVAGAGVSGRATIAPLSHLGAHVTVTDRNADALARCAELGADTVELDRLLEDNTSLRDFALVVTSPGFPPSAPLLSRAAGAALPIWGDIELSWRIDRAEIYGPARRWLVVTGTNGKTTTTTMLHAILEAAGIPSAACGNIGLPVLDVLRRSEPRADVLAVELSSFQLHWAPSVRPDAGVILNIAEDHLDWHGGIENYIEAKLLALTGTVGVLGLDDPIAGSLRDRSRAVFTVGFTLGYPDAGELGISGDVLVDRAFADSAVLASVDDVTPPGPAGLSDALAAAALARAIDVPESAVHDGLLRHRVGPHRAAPVGVVDQVHYIDDSKATNPHAARSSLLAHDRVVWIAGGLLKGARVDDLVVEVAPRLSAVVLLGRDAGEIADALTRHAPEVPVVLVDTRDDGAMTSELPGEARGQAGPRRVAVPGADAPTAMRVAVQEAAALARPGEAVLLAPAAASLDMFADYAQRGRSFVAAVEELRRGGTER